MCHSDVLVLTGVSLDARKYVFGHEIAGVPVRCAVPWSLIGEEAHFEHDCSLGSQVDKRIMLGKLYSVLTPNIHDHGIKGGSVLLNTLGLGEDGGYAEYVIVKSANLVAVVGLRSQPQSNSLILTSNSQKVSRPKPPLLPVMPE